jgi:hypothetical protein
MGHNDAVVHDPSARFAGTSPARHPRRGGEEGAGTAYDVPVVTTVTSNGAAVRRRLRLPLIAALALAFISLSLISGIAYIVVLAGATNTAEKFVLDRAGRVVDAQTASIKIKLDAVTDRLQMVAALAGSGRLDISSPVDVRETLWVMMTQVPHPAGWC